uniref:Uncharacterized protein n=1 Tax=Xiphophorus couchianus TaxID=32473 RepID=A0A3B5MCG9_9TELE
MEICLRKAVTLGESHLYTCRPINDPGAFNIPLDILEEIFLNLPAHKVVCVCRLVCHHWKDVADNESLWRQRCRREGYNLHESSKVPSDWRFFYFMCKKRRNLIKNPRGEDEFKDWTIVRNGGDGWRVEKPIALHPNAEVQTNFVTSFRMCTKSQLIDLVNEGYSQAFMDEVQPHIKSNYKDLGRIHFKIYFMTDPQLNALQTLAFKLITQMAMSYNLNLCKEIPYTRWMIHVFKDYGPGVRYVYFEHGGKDSVFWAGWYGIRLTETSIELCPALDKQNY